jgi:hypothetical protein
MKVLVNLVLQIHQTLFISFTDCKTKNKQFLKIFLWLIIITLESTADFLDFINLVSVLFNLLEK